MLTDELRTQIRAAHAALRAGAPGYRNRAPQNAMAGTIARTLAEDEGPRICVLEAPTGTGKTLGYALGALPVAKVQERPVIIATATVALQSQLVEKDLPTFTKHTGLELDVVVGKGRARYLCPRNLALASGSNPDQGALELGVSEDDVAVWDRRPTPTQRDQVHALADAWSKGTWTGDLDHWPEPIEGIVRERLTSTASACTGNACPHATRCPAMIARRAVLGADVVVTNHAQLIADLALGGGAVLPELDDAVVVVDEAHRLAAAAIEGFAADITVHQLSTWLKRQRGRLETALRPLPDSIASAEARAFIADELRVIATGLAELIPALNAKVASSADADRFDTNRSVAPRPAVFTQLGPVEDSLKESFRFLAEHSTAVMSRVRTIREKLNRAVRDGQVKAQQGAAIIGAIGGVVDRLDQLAAVGKAWSREDEDDHAPVARWIESVRVGRENDLRVASSPVSAAAMLRAVLFGRAHAVVLTSATLTAMGEFDTLRRELGLSSDDGTVYSVLPSTFDLPRQASLVIPWMAGSPKDAAVHTREVARIVAERASGSAGTLVLFTSRAQLQGVYELIPDALRDKVLCQTDASTRELIAKHKRTVDDGRASIIFGMQSFAEGLDLVGRYCEHLIVAKLPFPVPDGPIERTREAWLKKSGRNYFAEVAVPETQRRLIQWFGRLIRSETDTGVITLCDRRLVETTYGRRMLDTLPPFTVVVEPRPVSTGSVSDRKPHS